jgi:hypothetical protein
MFFYSAEKLLKVFERKTQLSHLKYSLPRASCRPLQSADGDDHSNSRPLPTPTTPLVLCIVITMKQFSPSKK